MSRTTEPVKPVDKVQIWPLEAAIWRNQTRDNPPRSFYTVTLSRSYKDGDAYKHTDTLNKDDLLLARKVLDHAHTKVLRLEQKDREENAAG